LARLRIDIKAVSSKETLPPDLTLAEAVLKHIKFDCLSVNSDEQCAFAE